MKKLICVILALALLCASALAAGSFNLGRDFEEKYQDGVSSAAQMGDTLYMLGYNHVFEWHMGDADVTVYEMSTAPDDDNVYSRIQNIFVWNDRLCVLCVNAFYGDSESRIEGAGVAELTLSDGKAEINELLALETDDLIISEGGYEYFCQINGIVCTGDYLCMSMYDSSYMPAVYIVNLGDGSGYFAPTENAESVVPYDEGRILVRSCDYDAQKISFDIYDIENESLTAACEPLDMATGGSQAGLAYDSAADTLYFLSEGYLKAAEHFDLANAKNVAELSGEYYNNQPGLLLPGGYYAFSGYDGTFIRSTNPDDMMENYLSVQDYTYSQTVNHAYDSFNNSHADIAAVISREYREDAKIIEDMMNRASDTDIYIMANTMQAYSALYDRGYMLDLSGNEKIREFVNGMYPALRDACVRGDEIVSLPVQIYGFTLCADMKGFEALGYAREDIPTYWPDFLDFLNTIADELPEDGSIRIFDSYMTQRDARWNLFYEIMNDYSLYLSANGREKGYDTPELNAALEKLQQVDFEAMGLREAEEDEETEGFIAYDVNPDSHTLLQTGNGCTLGNFCYNGIPLLLSFDADAEGLIPIDLYSAFVNPFSENPDAAMDFLSALVENADDSLLYNTSDRLNDPMHYSGFEESIAEWEEEIRKMRDSLAEAEPVDVPVLEEQIAESERYLEEYRNNGWQVSPESIEWFRAHAGQMTVNSYDYLNGDNASEVYELYSQFIEGKIDVKTLLKGIDQKAKMMAMEGN